MRSWDRRLLTEQVEALPMTPDFSNMRTARVIVCSGEDVPQVVYEFDLDSIVSTGDEIKIEGHGTTTRVPDYRECTSRS